jgi:hypothetical protein
MKSKVNFSGNFSANGEILAGREKRHRMGVGVSEITGCIPGDRLHAGCFKHSMGSVWRSYTGANKIHGGFHRRT